MSVTISGDVSVSGDVVGRDKMSGNGGEVACDFIWKGAVIKALCYPEDQKAIQRTIDHYLDGDTPKDKFLAKAEALSPNLVSSLKRNGLV